MRAVHVCMYTVCACIQFVMLTYCISTYIIYNAYQQFPDGYFDYVYLDAMHDYCSVNDELQLWWPKIRRGGIFAGQSLKMNFLYVACMQPANFF